MISTFWAHYYVFLVSGRHCLDSAAKETEASEGANSFAKVTHFRRGRSCLPVDFLKIGLILETNLC